MNTNIIECPNCWVTGISDLITQHECIKREFYPASHILKHKSSTTFGFAKQRYDLTFSNGHQLKQCIFDLPDALLQDPLKLLNSILFHMDEKKSDNITCNNVNYYVIAVDSPRELGAGAGNTTPRLMSIISEVGNICIGNDNCSRFVTYMLAHVLGAKKCVTPDGIQHQIRCFPTIFTESVVTDYNARYGWYKNIADQMRPYTVRAIGECENYIRKKASADMNRVLIRDYLRIFVGLSDGDIEFVFKQTHLTNSLNTKLSMLFIKNSGLAHYIPPYHKDTFKAAVNGVIVDGQCSLCWAITNGGLRHRNHTHSQKTIAEISLEAAVQVSPIVAETPSAPLMIDMKNIEEF
jgi:hypothetical protein